MKDIKIEDIKRAIRIINFSKSTHESWIKYLDTHKGIEKVQKQAKIAGGIDHHKGCIKGYEFVISVLEKML